MVHGDPIAALAHLRDIALAGIKATPSKMAHPDSSETELTDEHILNDILIMRQSLKDGELTEWCFKTFVRLFLEGKIERYIDPIEQCVLYRVYGPKGWSNRYGNLYFAFSEAGYSLMIEGVAGIQSAISKESE